MFAVRQNPACLTGDFRVRTEGDKEANAAYAQPEFVLRGNAANSQINDHSERLAQRLSCGETELGEVVDARIVTGDFAIFLHRNPGARRVWEIRENRLADARKKVLSVLL